MGYRSSGNGTLQIHPKYENSALALNQSYFEFVCSKFEEKFPDEDHRAFLSDKNRLDINGIYIEETTSNPTTFAVFFDDLKVYVIEHLLEYIGEFFIGEIRIDGDYRDDIWELMYEDDGVYYQAYELTPTGKIRWTANM